MPFTRETALERLTEAHRTGRLAHAYLLTGSPGSGKSWLAERLAALMLECGQDRVLTHPDAHILRPESKSRRIVIDQIRELEQSIQRKPLVAPTKVVIIHEADRMQPQAANAFLKTLEEPPSGSLILLLSSLPEAILETVLSRCVETPLFGGPARQRTEEEEVLLRALDDCLNKPARPGAAEAFQFTRTVQRLLTALREKISSGYEDTLKEETARYKQASEGSSWLDERAGQMKALSEAGALRERDRLLQIVFEALSSALRSQHGCPADHPVARTLAEKFSTKNLLARLDALEILRRRLALGVQEALALESGFLEMIALPGSRHPS
ncbi:MAG TPA: AAA family ATPase [Terrimicrobiaceae bacterium]|nr:AAA family ATPase [Terrimicrobiaceae bacterium]